jgi:ABC-type Fe3+ transport system substrate-binding protein
MINSVKRWRWLAILVMAAWVGSVGSASAQPANVDAAKKEGKLVIYGTAVPQVMGVIEKGFETQYGIKIEYWRADATKVIDRAFTEWRSGRPGFDLVTGARGSLLLAKQENMFTKFLPTTASGFPVKFKDPDGKLTAWRVTPVGILYNTETVKSADVPKSFDDLLDPKWNGKIGMPDPSRHGSTAQLLWNFSQVKGEKWMDFVRGLAKQKPLLMEAYSSVPLAIVRGEVALGLTYIQYVVQTKGPIGYAQTESVFADPSDMGLSAKAANPNAAKLYLEYLCSLEGQKKIAETGEFVLHPGVFPTIKGADKIMASAIFLENPSAEQLAKLQSDFRPLFLSK